MDRILSSKVTNFVGEHVRLSGWVSNYRDHGQLIFIDLRDYSGKVQLVIDPANKETFSKAKELGMEYVIDVEGKVVERSPDLVNDKIETGSIEIEVEKIELLNSSLPLPFPIDTDGREIDENLRLKYRYLDIRRERIKQLMQMRHRFTLSVRNWFSDNGFLEVTTPLLTSTSPEGARDYYVPSRIHKGKFFVLPQAPQQFKQLLMVGGVDRYFQIAPCARDEDPRADRHAGVFYQIDIEISFPTVDIIFDVAERMLADTYKVVAPDKKLKTPFPRISLEESLDKYGTDKPDIRFGIEINDGSELIKGATELKFFNEAEVVKYLVVPGGAMWSRKELDEMEQFAKNEGAKGLAYLKVDKDGFEGGIAKFFEGKDKEFIVSMNAKDGDLILFGAGARQEVNKYLGAVRSLIGQKMDLKDPNMLAGIWITDFPFYEIDKNSGKLDFGHNPFSMPKGGMSAFETDDPLKIQTHQYDLAMNGYEMLSGSIRNHDPEVLVKAFEVVGYGRDEVIKRFGGLFNAFHYGAPPHGGWAIGLDRMLMVLVDEPNIRDVYAFPKNSNGMDVMMNAPSIAPQEDLDILGIELQDKGDEVMEKIINLLDQGKIKYELMEHEPVRTSEQAAKVRGTKLSDATKAMILRSKEYVGKYFMVVIPADKQLDLDKASNVFGEDVEVSPAEEVEKYTGIQVGGVPPFGRLIKMDLFFDKSIYEKQVSVFNAGRRDRSIQLKTSDLIKVAQPDKKSIDIDFLSE